MGLREWWCTATVHLWLLLAGLRESLCLHRCIVFFVLDGRILEKTAKCFVLNGIVFLGSLAALHFGLAPAFSGLLAGVGAPWLTAAASAAARWLLHLAWLLPIYTITFLVNIMWCSEIAELTTAAAQRRAQQRSAERRGAPLPPPPAQGGLAKVRRLDPLTVASQEAYKMLLLGVFLLQTYAVWNLPLIGPSTSALMMAWLYALYCFDYSWGLHGVPLPARIQELEEGWAFFLGFGALTILPGMVSSFYVGAALLGVLFPMFIITACDSNPRAVYRKASEWQRQRGAAAAFPRLPIFWAAVATSNAVVAAFVLLPTVLDLGKRLLGRRQTSGH